MLKNNNPGVKSQYNSIGGIIRLFNIHNWVLEKEFS